MVPVQSLEGEMGLAGHLDIRDHFVLVLVQAGEHLRLTTVVDEVALTDLVNTITVYK